MDEFGEGALEALQVEMQVEDLVHADRLRGRDGLLDRPRDRALDLVDRAAGDREHDDEGDLALSARHLEVKALVLMAQDLDVAPFQAASADGAVVKPRAVANEIDDAHDGAHITPRVCGGNA